MRTVQQLTSHRWQASARPLEVLTEDGVRIAVTRLGVDGSDLPALVLGHGLMGWHRKPRLARFAERLTEWFTVYAFDFRGHGSSGGTSDYGCSEIHDVEAVAGLARRAGHPAVVTCGTSMGAIAVLRHGGLIGGVQTVVGISSLAYWDWHGGAAPKARRKMQARIATPVGRAALRLWGVRLPGSWQACASPEEVVGRIAPTPLVLVHGENDYLFGPDHAFRLLEAAAEPKRLLLGDRFGHAEDGLSEPFATRLASVVLNELGLPWPA
jgi:pimeloyl-ACP methyl ester carboxylesterase